MVGEERRQKEENWNGHLLVSPMQVPVSLPFLILLPSKLEIQKSPSTPSYLQPHGPATMHPQFSVFLASLGPTLSSPHPQ